MAPASRSQGNLSRSCVPSASVTSVSHVAAASGALRNVLSRYSTATPTNSSTSDHRCSCPNVLTSASAVASGSADNTFVARA